MSAVGLERSEVRFPLRPGRGEVALHASGFRHPASSWTRAERFTAYRDVTHLQVGSRQLRIGTRQGVWILPRAWFVEAGGAEQLVRALCERIAAAPDGRAQLAAMADAEELLHEPRRLRVAPGVAALCIGVFGLGQWLGPIVHHAGFMSPLLAADGEPWRLLTANFLHADGTHLTLNVFGLLALGALVERPLGALRTVLVLGISGVAATASAWLAGYDALVGASGMVAGLAGALLWLELRRAELLPAGWRIPRRAFLAALAADALLPLALPIVAGAAHVSGFLAGALAAGLCAGRGLRREPMRPDALLAVGLVAAIVLASLVSAGRLVFGTSAWEGHAERLLEAERPPALILNDAAWLIATADHPSERALTGAVELAERAVRATGGQDPNVLDTLAEAQWRTGDERGALDTIDEAIALQPEEPYFREQRRRFTGERAAADRPEPPEGWLPPAAPVPAPWEHSEEPGVSI
ncbi:MAG: rhomboid family intramembrane serine protease [Deltaproteobacteria bacterium]|nr:rhomboid family intramembrane serine protease [Deltaproteobacteria bacterium]